MSVDKKRIDRRKFFKLAGGGTAITAAALAGCSIERENTRGGIANKEIPKDKMTYRTNPKTDEKISLLGYGMMRLPMKKVKTEKGEEDIIDQEAVNELVDYAIEHGVNYFDTAPVYCQGKSELATGIALSRHPREKYFIATKLSNFDPRTHSREASLRMYEKSFEELKVDYIDYMLLHAIGGGGMKTLNDRYIDNGVLDFLIEERKKGKIRNLGFSYHGDIAVYDYLLSRHDEIKWDFVQIQMNYLDWEHAKQINKSNTNAKYLYAELEKRGIPVVIMEPLLGGRLANINFRAMSLIRQVDTENSIASWAFRYAGTPEKILTVLSGMTYMEHLQDNILTYSPLKPINERENILLEGVAKSILEFKNISCTQCQYCKIGRAHV